MDTWMWGGLEGSSREGHLDFGQGDAPVLPKANPSWQGNTRCCGPSARGWHGPASLAVAVLFLDGGADPAAATRGHRRGPVTRDT